MRAFVAVPFPSGLCSRVGLLQEALMRSDADVRWISSANLHLTLKFLGDVDDGEVVEMATELGAEISCYNPLELQFEGVGQFPKGGPPRVIWVGCRGDVRKLSGLALLSERMANLIGVPEERRSFSPHLTIGRVKSGRNRDALLRAMKARSDEVIGPLRVEKICLYRSTLTSRGAVYDVVREFPLAGES